jgi:potassium efflux system protein
MNKAARLAFKCIAPLVLALLLPLAALAQTVGPDYEAWAKVADRTETAIENDRASTAAFEELRSEIVGWRQTFLTAQETNAQRIATLRAQIAALGPIPVDGEPAESDDIVLRRKALNDQLTRLQAPALTADEAYTHADGMIGEIDAIIRDRQTTELFTLGPSPLVPTYWPRALNEISGTYSGLRFEYTSAWENPIQNKTLRDRLPAVLGLLILGLILIARGRNWTKALDASLRKRAMVQGFWGRFLLSTGQIALPMLGVYAIAEALNFSGIAGPRTQIIVDGLPFWAAILIVGRWLAGLIFADSQDEAIYKLGEDKNRQARALIFGLTLVLAVRELTAVMTSHEQFSDEARVVVGFVLVLLGSFQLFRLAQILTVFWRASEDESGYRRRILTLVGRGMLLTAIMSPILAAIGYETAANGLVFPAIQTLGPIGLVVVLQMLVVEIYVLITREEDGREALVPVLLGYILAAASLPLLALIWGTRVADLSELWTRIQEGLSIGNSRISPADFLGFVLVFVIGYTITRVLPGALRTTVLPKTRIDAGGQNAIVAGTGYIGIFLAAVLAISSAGIDLSSIAIVAGALSVGIGFGLQNIVSNFVSGIILLIERPIALGDWIEVGGQMGYVRDISVRSTRIETFDRTDVIVPNSDLVSGQVTNWTRGNLRGRVIVPVGVAYGSDTKQVESILLDIAKSQPNVMQDPAPSVYFQGFGASSLDFEIRAILKDVNWILQTKSDINHAVAKRFVEAGIEIPFNQSEITIRNLDDWLAREKPS